MELTLQVNDDVARKIRGLSVLTGKSASEITDDISNHIDGLITTQIIESVGGNVAPLTVNQHVSPLTSQQTSGLAQVFERQNDEESYDIFEQLEAEGEMDEDESPEELEELIYPEEDVDSDYEDEEYEGAAEGLADITEEEAEEMDEALPQSFFKEDEEGPVAIKNKDGQETGYEDELMADIQAMAEEDFEDMDSGLVTEDPALAAASPKTRGAAISALSEVPSDAGISSLDVLPTDYDIDRVSGNNAGAADFFNKAFFGVEGDKSKRNQIKRKHLRRD